LTYENDVEYRRTAVIKLDTPEGADAHLRETVEQFKYCSNTASEWCWHGDDGYHVTSKAKAEDGLYDQLREDTELTANLVQKGIHQAVEAIKSGVERLKTTKTRPVQHSRRIPLSTTNEVPHSTATTFRCQQLTGESSAITSSPTTPSHR
jgi:hypothetical protein